MTCSSCGRENRPGRKFCSACGASLAIACPDCGAANEPDDAFCGECGAGLSEIQAPPAARDVERRLVSVLFADLVGSTSLAEERDAEEVRELLTRYFDAARRVIERYGGTVEKFIGDAVMAVWGTPLAQEDDAERAVRAGLELVETVAEIDLVARVAVLTGEAAATVGATGQSMVAGDLVNTASRVQSLAAGGTVLVGDATYRATRAAIAYADAGVHEVKGRDEPVALWQALRVTARLGGAATSDLLEPPFVGRARELRLLKDTFHASAEARRAQLVSVVGLAGIGKSRLSWELAKYLDGVSDQVLWHRGRCLAYGDGVTYSALAEMVRMRCGIVEGEEAKAARAKLHATVEDYVAAAEDREWVEPRLAHLLALEERSAADDTDLFAAWRLFFERLAERHPVVLVFEDVQWADTALLAFVEYLLEWSSAHPIVVVSLARPELGERHPAWPQARVDATTLVVDPLIEEAMRELVAGLVPGLPEDVCERIVERAEGIPLYAVETVRMLLDRGLIERDDDHYRLTGPLDALDTPETLHALLAARLDGLDADERRVVEAAAVLGKTFSKDALAAQAGISGERLDALLAGLVRKEVLFLQADPRSPERGQYGFLQDLLRQVAYETLSRKERRARHLAVAAWLEEHRDDPDVVEIVAAHYLAAYESDPHAEDAPATRERARALLVRAGERAASLAAPADAQLYFERALELAAGDAKAVLHEQTGIMALRASRFEDSRAHFEEAIAGFETQGLMHAAARASGWLALETFVGENDLERAVADLQRAYDVLARGEPDADVAKAAAELARLLMLAGRGPEAFGPVETALEIGESLRLPEVVSEALNTKGVLLRSQGRPQEARALLQRALEVALEDDLAEAAVRAYGNLAYLAALECKLEEGLEMNGLQLQMARKFGNGPMEQFALRNRVSCLADLGRWDEALALAAEVEASEATVELLVHRGDLPAAREVLARERGRLDRGNPQWLAGFKGQEARLLLAEGKPAEALAATREALGGDLSRMGHNEQWCLTVALDAAFAADDSGAVDELLAVVERLTPGARGPLLDAAYARGAARRAALRGDAAEAERLFAQAVEIFREVGMRFSLGQALLDHAEWLTAEGRTEEATSLYSEAEEIFESLGATPWLERIAPAAAAPA